MGWKMKVYVNLAILTLNRSHSGEQNLLKLFYRWYNLSLLFYTCISIIIINFFFTASGGIKKSGKKWQDIELEAIVSYLNTFLSGAGEHWWNIEILWELLRNKINFSCWKEKICSLQDFIHRYMLVF